ncbi:MAG: hypothetical protein FJW37_06720 [Acidobacteria bacterium]|nr:hypothetical protein [Acidobacteriota bacterium]
MTLRKLACLIVAADAPLLAAVPFVGAWKLNAAKTKYTAGQPPKDQTITIAQHGDHYDVRITGAAANGAPISQRYKLPMKGGKGAVQESAVYDDISTQRIDQNTRENSYFKGGKQVLSARVSVSQDGKTLTGKLKGTDLAGQPVVGTLVLDRQ